MDGIKYSLINKKLNKPNGLLVLLLIGWQHLGRDIQGFSSNAFRDREGARCADTRTLLRPAPTRPTRPVWVNFGCIMAKFWNQGVIWAIRVGRGIMRTSNLVGNCSTNVDSVTEIKILSSIQGD